jgi:NAD(P)-dependent dehydrogenase (short-subunit alcohol dehydrogenase family)
MRVHPGRILVTGAGRGIGRAIAERFLRAGWRVGVYDVDVAAAAQVVSGHDNGACGHLDVRDEEQWREVLAGYCGDGGLDVLVNNAGVLASGPYAGIAPSVHRHLVEVNLIGVLNGCTQAHPYLRRSKRGMLVNLCSASALYGQASLATYGATKAAVKSLTEALDLEWAADGIRVRSLLPLFVATDMVTRDATAAKSVQRLGIHLTPDDVAAAAWRVVHERPRRFGSPHRPVGLQTRLLSAASAVSPDWAVRLVARAIAG